MAKISLSSIRHSIRWNLFFTLGAIMLVCQMITVIWLWHESKEQIDAIVDVTLNQTRIDNIIAHEENEALFALFLSTFTMTAVTLFLSYKAIKRIIKPLEKLQQDLILRTADDLEPISFENSVSEVDAIILGLNSLFVRLNDTLVQERLFTADVAHELRTPLAGIRLHLELLSKKHQFDFSPLIARIDRLVRTVEQLLMLSRASQKFTMGQYQQIDVYQDIELALFDELLELTMTKKQQLTWNVQSSSLTFTGDVTLVKLLMRNLVENAYRYSPQYSHILITIYQHEHTIIAEVMDEGSGIDESKQALLTQAFFSMDRKHQGIGLGLSIVSRITKLHQAKFSLMNRQDGKPGTIAQVIFNQQITP